MKRSKIVALGLALALAISGAGIAVAQGTDLEDGELAGGEDGQMGDAVFLGTPAIGFDQAVKAAESYAKSDAASSAALEDENGSLSYAVSIAGVDVKVDTMTGSVLRVESGSRD